MDVMTALKNFERLTGKPVSVLNAEIQDYGVTIQDIADGKMQPGEFLSSELASILTENYRIAVEVPEAAAQWDFLYKAMEESDAFRRYCRDVHGNALIQMNELDNATLEQILSLLQLDATHSALDVGCGNGYLTEFISDRTGAKLLGIDVSAYAIRLASERTKSKRERLAFRVGDINEIGDILRDYPSVDAIIAMEVLYASSDLDRTIGELAALLSGKGQMLLIANQHIRRREAEAHKLSPDHTDLAVAIQKQALPVRVLDITQNKLHFLERSISLLERYQPAFAQEGNTDFWAARIVYDKKMLRRVRNGLTRRYLYYVSKAGRI